MLYVCMCVCALYFNIGEVTLHLDVDGNNPEESEIFLEERIAGVMYQYFSIDERVREPGSRGVFDHE